MKTNILFTVGIAMMLWVGCGDQADQQAASKKARSTSQYLKNAQEYFPIQVGRQWTYVVVVPDSFSTKELKKPLSQEQITVPANDGDHHNMTVRGLIGATLLKKDSFILTLRITRRAEDQGIAGYANWHEVFVVKDELGIFEEFSQIFYGSTSRNGYSVMQLGKPKDLPDGMSPRPIFVGQKSARIGVRGKGDYLRYVSETAHDGRPAVLFRREVEVPKEAQNRSKPDWLDRAFTEDVICVSGVGPVSMVQKVDGIETMRWTLRE